MKSDACLLDAALFVALASSLVLAQAAPLATVQNSALAVPAASIVAAGLAGSTNLLGSNFMVSAVLPATLRGGRATLVSSQEWVRRYNAGPTSFQNAGYAMAVCPDGRVAVAGPSLAPITGYDFVTISYSPDGTPLWTNRYDGPEHGNDIARYVGTAGAADVWVAGESMRYATNSALTDVTLIRYASNGIPVWTNRYTSFDTNAAYPTELVVDGSGNAYVKLWSIYWGPSGSGSLVEDAVVKYDATGNALWTNHYPASAPDSGDGLHGVQALALDRAGHLFAAGPTGGEHFTFGNSVVKYAADGTALWTNHHSAQVVSQLSLLALDRNGNVVVTGENWSNYTGIYVVMKYSSDGASLWTNTMTGPTYDGGDVPETVLDPAGNVFLIGGKAGVSSPGLYQILKLSSDGVPLWTNQAADFGPTNCMIYGSAVDSAGNLYLTGKAPAPGNGSADYVTVKYSGDGQALWTNRFDGPAGLRDIPFALAVDGAGSVYITGESERAPGDWDLTTVKYADRLFYTPPQNFTGSDTITYTLTDDFGNSATGSVAVLVMPGSFQFNLAPAATALTPGGMQLQVDGAPSTNGVVIEASTDLVHWQPILTNTPANGSVQFVDSAATSLPRRFYRALQQQAR